jgi:plasmid stabilization system protein ParE
MTLLVSCDAKFEILEISDWYDLKDAGTGERFMSALDRKFDEMCAHPNIYPSIAGSELRKCRIEKWPYLIFFTVDELKVEVVAVIHASRDPEYISSRLKS